MLQNHFKDISGEFRWQLAVTLRGYSIFLVTARRAFRLIATPPRLEWCIVSTVQAIAIVRVDMHGFNNTSVCTCNVYVPSAGRPIVAARSVIGCQPLYTESQRLFEHHSRASR